MSQTYQKSNDAFTVIDQKYLNTEQAAKYLSVTEYTMRKYANAGLIPYYRPGGRGCYLTEQTLTILFSKARGNDGYRSTLMVQTFI